jgi:serine/threonine protein kinase
MDCNSLTRTSEVLGVAHNSFLDQKHSCSDRSAPVGYQELLVPHIQISDIAFGDMIGQGAFGKVFKGEWLGTTVAVKEMLVKRINIVKPMIEREMNVHSRIRHPCIVQLMAVAVSKNKLYLVTEYVDGSNLDDVIFCRESSEAVSPLCKLEIAQKIVQAVTYLHNQCPPIIHRDIKPENILVSRDLSIVRLCDMGLSKLKSLNTLITTIATSSEMQPGTPAYQPPEVLVHRQKGNVQSDIWSLSCTLLELFAEVPTWDLEMDGDDVQCIVERMKEKKRPDGVSKLVGKVNVPLQVVDTIVKGLDYDPEKRPSAMSILKSFQLLC